jgi:hypothetical protein
MGGGRHLDAIQPTLFPHTVGTETACCDHCGQFYRASEEPDPCIGRHLPGVAGCCCGHGDLSRAYVDLDTAWDEATAATAGHWNHDMLRSILLRHRLTGEAALEFLSNQDCGPKLVVLSKRVTTRTTSMARTTEDAPDWVKPETRGTRVGQRERPDPLKLRPRLLATPLRRLSRRNSDQTDRPRQASATAKQQTNPKHWKSAPGCSGERGC